MFQRWPWSDGSGSRPRPESLARHAGQRHEVALVPPLRKRSLEGVIYTRDARIEAKILELGGLSREEVLVRLAITRRSDPAYVPSECLVHLVRATRMDNSERHFQKLYELLMGRVIKGLPRPDSASSDTTSLPLARIRDAVLDKVKLLLVADRRGYCEALDFFEVRFDGALAKARLDASVPVWKDARRNIAIEVDEEVGANEEIERSLGGFDPFTASDYESKDYRLKLDQAIDTLPPEQKRIVEMLRLEFPIDSDDPDELTISKALGKSEKTVRKYRDRAFDQIRAALTKARKP